MPAPSVALNYNLYVQQIATLAIYNTLPGPPVTGVEPFFNTLIPQMINYAELRIQRDVDLFQLQTSLTYAVAPLSAQLVIPNGDFVTLQSFQVRTVAPPPLVTSSVTPVSKSWLQAVYSNSPPGPPVYYAPFGGDEATSGQTSTIFLLGPSTDQDYTAILTGVTRMPSLANTLVATPDGSGTTWIATWMPDLMIAASMIYVTAAQRNFGAASSDPQMGMSWEGVYQSLLTGVTVEEAKKHFEGAGWTTRGPAPVATPTRG